MVTFPLWGWALVILFGGCISVIWSRANPKPKSVSDVLPYGFDDSLSIDNKIAFDDIGQKFCIAEFKDLSIGYCLVGTYNYSDIIDYEILENGHAVQGGGLGSAVAGGLLFGGAGAVTGAVVGKKTTGYNVIMQVRIKMRSQENPVINMQWTYDGSANNPQALQYVYQLANKLDDILGRKKEEPAPAPVKVAVPADPPDPYAELEKLSALHDKGILTEDEFQKKKDELLSRI